MKDGKMSASFKSAYGNEVQICQVKGLDSVTEIILDCRPSEVCEKIQEFVGRLKFEFDDAAENLHISFSLDFEGEK